MKIKTDDGGTAEPIGLELTAELRQLKTMADGTVNVTINVPEYCMDQAKIMLGWLGEEIRLVIVKINTV